MMQAHLMRRVALGAGLVGLILAGTGCVERKLTIASDPPGALAYVNDVEVGRTPVTIPFLWYGDYDIRLRLERTVGPTTQATTQAATQAMTQPTTVQYELHTHRRATAPWFQWLGVDLVTELIPVEFKDEKIWAFNIPQVPEVSDEELVQHAKALQAQLSTQIGLQRNPPLTPTTGAATMPAGKR